jgi:hypothetical protein
MDKKQSKEQAAKSIKVCFALAKKFVESGQEHPPLMVVELDDGRGAVVGVDFLPTKDMVADLHRFTAAQPEVTSATLVMEAWLHQGKPGDPLGEALVRGDVRVADLPGREEVVLFNCIVGEWQWLCACKIDRERGSLEMGELFGDDDDGATVGGRMAKGSADTARKRKLH